MVLVQTKFSYFLYYVRIYIYITVFFIIQPGGGGGLLSLGTGLSVESSCKLLPLSWQASRAILSLVSLFSVRFRWKIRNQRRSPASSSSSCRRGWRWMMPPSGGPPPRSTGKSSSSTRSLMPECAQVNPSVYTPWEIYPSPRLLLPLRPFCGNSVQLRGISWSRDN